MKNGEQEEGEGGGRHRDSEQHPHWGKKKHVDQQPRGFRSRLLIAMFFVPGVRMLTRISVSPAPFAFVLCTMHEAQDELEPKCPTTANTSWTVRKRIHKSLAALAATRIEHASLAAPAQKNMESLRFIAL